MLDEVEWVKIHALWKSAFQADGNSMDARFQPLRDLYKEITGVSETNENAIIHHRISLYGPPCANCGKPLRTPEASFCAACGHNSN